MIPSQRPGRGLLIPHGYLNPGKSEHSEVQNPSIIDGASLCFMGGPPTDLKNMADRQEWKGQISIYIWNENLVAESEAKNGGNCRPVPVLSIVSRVLTSI